MLGKQPPIATKQNVQIISSMDTLRKQIILTDALTIEPPENWSSSFSLSFNVLGSTVLPSAKASLFRLKAALCRSPGVEGKSAWRMACTAEAAHSAAKSRKGRQRRHSITTSHQQAKLNQIQVNKHERTKVEETEKFQSEAGTKKIQRSQVSGPSPGIFFEPSCADHHDGGSHWTVKIIVMVRQRWLKRGQGRRSRSNTHNTNKNTPTNNKQKSLTEHGEKVKQAQALTAIGYLHIPGSHYVFSRKYKVQSIVGDYVIPAVSSTCFLFFIRQVEISCWPRRNCNVISLSSSRTWA